MSSNASQNFVVFDAVVVAQTCHEIGNRELLSQVSFDLVGYGARRLPLGNIFVCFLVIFYTLTHSRIKAAALLTFHINRKPMPVLELRSQPSAFTPFIVPCNHGYDPSP